MKTIAMKRILVMLFTICSFSVYAQEWELKKEENGVLVYTKDNGTPYRSVQSVTVIKTSLSQAVALVMDVDRFPQWIFKCQSAKVLEKRSENDIIHYQVNQVPFIKDRDMVIQLVKTEDEQGDITITQKALPDYTPRVDDYVRITKFDGMWNLKSTAEGVEVKYTIDTDPGSDLPKKLVNKATVQGPLETMMNMKTLLEQNVQTKAK
jgi:ribosome-associated toxin RatA of RatAB toxin-antitoxin module